MIPENMKPGIEYEVVGKVEKKEKKKKIYLPDNEIPNNVKMRETAASLSTSGVYINCQNKVDT